MLNFAAMKIIGKHKDYYDYLQGVWGQDPKAVYVRTSPTVFNAGNRPAFLAAQIPEGVAAWQGELVVTAGGAAHHVFFRRDRAGTVTEPFLSIPVEREEGAPPLLLEWYVDVQEIDPPRWRRFPSREEAIRKYTMMADGTLLGAVRRNRPPRKGRPPRFEDIRGSAPDPILSTFPLVAVPAEDVFLGIQDWLLSKADPKVTDNRTDVQKLEAAGFDRRTSFRKTK